MGNIHAIGESVHITSDESLTWNQIYQIIADALGVQLNAVHVSSEFLDATSTQDFRGSLLGTKRIRLCLITPSSSGLSLNSWQPPGRIKESSKR